MSEPITPVQATSIDDAVRQMMDFVATRGLTTTYNGIRSCLNFDSDFPTTYTSTGERYNFSSVSFFVELIILSDPEVLSITPKLTWRLFDESIYQSAANIAIWDQVLRFDQQIATIQWTRGLNGAYDRQLHIAHLAAIRADYPEPLSLFPELKTTTRPFETSATSRDNVVALWNWLRLHPEMVVVPGPN